MLLKVLELFILFCIQDNQNIFHKDIKQFFEEAIDFIHQVRINNGNVLVHWYYFDSSSQHMFHYLFNLV
jgi:hypothetical protein